METEMTQDGRKVAEEFCLPDGIWERIEGLLPKFRPSRKGGRPRLEWRQVLNGIFCTFDGLPVETMARRIWICQFGTSILSASVEKEDFCQAVESGPGRI